MDQCQTSGEMPRYKCHKTVWALKIAEILQSPANKDVEGGSWEILPEDKGYGAITVPHAFVQKHNPQPGGYYVVYEDGYASYSPAAAFESGYTLQAPMGCGESQNVFAFTEPGHEYPAYISINRDDSGRLPGYRIAVRSAGNGGRDLGEIHVTPESLEHLAIEVMAAISGESKPDDNPLLTFGQALDLLKRGCKVARLGWNGTSMWLCLGEGRRIYPDEFWNVHTRKFAHEKASETPAGGDVTTQVLPYIIMKTAGGEVLMGWLASQTDMLAEDWVIVA